MKYKIVSTVMGDHRIFFKVKFKSFLFWHTLQESDGCGNGFDGTYSSIYDAEVAIRRDREYRKSKKVLFSMDIKSAD